MSKEERVDKLFGGIIKALEEKELPHLVYEDDLYCLEAYFDDMFSSSYTEKEKREEIKRYLGLDKFVVKEFKEAVDLIVNNLDCEWVSNDGFGREQENWMAFGQSGSI